jgi:hypothetical protein
MSSENTRWGFPSRPVYTRAQRGKTLLFLIWIFSLGEIDRSRTGLF